MLGSTIGVTGNTYKFTTDEGDVEFLVPCAALLPH